ncbi:uncharacterized protein LJ206_020367 [Theristicus caerulescens]
MSGGAVPVRGGFERAGRGARARGGMSGAGRREPSAQELTPLHVAASRGCCRCRELLLKQRGDPELPDQDGERAIDPEQGDRVRIPWDSWRARGWPPAEARPALPPGMPPPGDRSPPGSATSPPGPRAASRPPQHGSAPPLPPPSSMRRWRCPGGPPGSEHPGVSPGTLPPPRGTASPRGARTCPAGTERGQALWMTPRSSLEPLASPAPRWGPAAPLAPAPRSCWSLGTTGTPRAPHQMLGAPPAPAPRSCWPPGTTGTPRAPHQVLGAPPAPAPRSCWPPGTTGTPRAPHQMLGAPPMPPAAPAPGCWRVVLGGRTPRPWGHTSPRGPTGASATS